MGDGVPLAPLRLIRKVWVTALRIRPKNPFLAENLRTSENVPRVLLGPSVRTMSQQL